MRSTMPPTKRRTKWAIRARRRSISTTVIAVFRACRMGRTLGVPPERVFSFLELRVTIE
jgi:hypothetical protein